ncbi:helix-turn-helix transcriptional regulator [Nocardia arthritidis]|uniref:WYL domain-containing protein n=1 Tax=Nocardia arthritidis TaxID=228602 RepID=A0A6G9YFY9_9NOCA|nr:YafY family protein [Nocardia arthritidis]QIS12122.1 WYL domain-containing protein [Nocardia arthritidis]
MRASRLVSILLLLQTRGRLTAAQLAEHLEVSVRTIYRDIDALSASGVPLFGEPGKDGGYQILDGYRTKLTGLTADEAQSLFLTGLPKTAADLGLGDAVTTARLKLTAALSPELRDRADRIAKRFLIDRLPWYSESEEVPFLPTVADAVWNQHLLTMRYHRQWADQTVVTRTVAPYGIVAKAGLWYLVARHTEQQTEHIRTYRVSRILRLDTLTETFDRPTDFELTDYWHTLLSDLDTRRRTGQAIVRLSPDALRRLPDVLDPLMTAAVEHTALTPDEYGWYRAVIPIESTERALGQLLSLGAGVEILAPADLREAAVAVIRGLANTYLTPACGEITDAPACSDRC